MVGILSKINFTFKNLIFESQTHINLKKGAQWLNGRVLDLRLKGRGFETHRWHYVVVLEQDTFILA